MITKKELITSGLVLDNEYLSKYIELVTSSDYTEKIPGLTQKHHIIPRFYYRDNGMPINENADNIVYLTFKNHILAHYYLALCSDKKYRFKNELAFMRTSNFRNIPKLKDFMETLGKYDDIYDSYIKDHTERMIGHLTSDETKQKISFANFGKRRTLEERKRISEATKRGMRKNPEISKRNSEYHKNTVWITDGKRQKQIKQELLDEYKASGWHIGKLAFSENALKNISLANKAIGEKIKGKVRYVNNGIKQKIVLITELESFLKNNSEWKLGQLSKPQYAKCKMMNNGIITKRVKEMEVDEYIKNGWGFGMKGKNNVS